jgi:hypothetical protein
MSREVKNKHYKALIENAKEVDRLQRIHSPRFSTTLPGKRSA